MPAGKGTYGSKKGRPPKKGKGQVSKGLAALAKKKTTSCGCNHEK